jgi:formylglycine-generating enzyme required for sulfatase activity
MGNDAGRADERPAHSVILAAFRAAVQPVSNGEYASFVVSSGHQPPPFWSLPDFSAAGQPVVGVSWFDAIAYSDWLSSVTGIPFRLPTEAEREYAARGGLDACDWPWIGDTTGFDNEIASLNRPHVPDSRCANGFGLMCMADNVHEWCSDWYDAAYYALTPDEAPPGPVGPADRRASRGGSWRHSVKYTRVSARSSLRPAYRYNDYGFRVYSPAL